MPRTASLRSTRWVVHKYSGDSLALSWLVAKKCHLPEGSGVMKSPLGCCVIGWACRSPLMLVSGPGKCVTEGVQGGLGTGDFVPWVSCVELPESPNLSG